MLRIATTVSALAGLALAVGCEWLDRMKTKDAGVKATGPVEAKSSADLVSYLNWQANSIQSVRSNDVYIELYVGKDKERHTLNDSSLVCAKPRNFLLVGGRYAMSNIVQIGSNEREFWMAARLPEPMYVFCAHADFPQVGDRMPFPFDPDWALEALGMKEYRTDLDYQAKTEERNREHQLWYDTTTPQGAAVRRVVVFAADRDVGTQPRVRRHLILDRDNKLLASADIREAAWVSVGADPQTGRPVSVQVPTKVALDWPQQQFKMSIEVRRPKVNEPISPAEANQLFTRPTISGVDPVNLATARFRPSSIRGATPGDGRRPFGRR